MGTRAEWADRVRRWRASELSGPAFAQREGIKVGTLRHWAWELEREAGRASDGGFVEVVVPLQESASGIEVVTRDGIHIRVERGFDDETLRRVLAVVEAR